jgi:hypothetical protein
VAVSAHDATLNRDNALHHIQGLNCDDDPGEAVVRCF